MSGTPHDRSFLARYGAIILKGGIASIPSAIYHYQGELGLSAQEVWFISAILVHKWDADMPYPSLSQMAAYAGVTQRSLHTYKHALVEKGYLEIHAGWTEKGGRAANHYDFSALFGLLEELIARDKALNKDGDTPMKVSSHTPMKVSSEPPMKVSSHHEESVEESVEEASYPLRGTRYPTLLRLKIRDIGKELRDTDPRGSLGRIVNLWQQYGSDEQEFIRRMHQARDVTRAQISSGAVHSGEPGRRNAIAYWFSVLENLLAPKA